jgi:hypothetical protein
MDLNPAGFDNSLAIATDGVQQVGQAWSSNSPVDGNAILWSSTAASAINLNPAGFADSYASGIAGNQQAGGGWGSSTGNNWHAVLWSGAAASAVDLNPAGFANSFGYGIAVNQQVGAGESSSTGNNFHALVWSGTAASAVDLNPSGFDYSYAYNASGDQQVGYGEGIATGGSEHAMLWSGTAASAVDLNPTDLGGVLTSYANATNGTEQVGFGQFDPGLANALLWSGTAASAVNLQLLLPPAGEWQDSDAYSIDANGNVFGIADGTLNGISGSFAVEWSPTPEPASFSIFVVSVLGLIRRRRGSCEVINSEEGGPKCSIIPSGVQIFILPSLSWRSACVRKPSD